MNTLGIFVVAFVIAFIGIEIVLQLDDLATVLRLSDVACP